MAKRNGFVTLRNQKNTEIGVLVELYQEEFKKGLDASDLALDYYSGQIAKLSDDIKHLDTKI